MSSTAVTQGIASRFLSRFWNCTIALQTARMKVHQSSEPFMPPQSAAIVYQTGSVDEE